MERCSWINKKWVAHGMISTGRSALKSGIDVPLQLGYLMCNLKKFSLLIVLLVLMGLAISCGSEQPEEATSTPASSFLDSARDAVGEAGENIGAAVEQAAESAQTAIENASDTAQTTVSQVGDVLDAAGTIIVDQGGEAVEVVSSAGQSASETVQDRFASLMPDDDGNFSVTIYETEINQILKIQELFTGPIPGNPLRNTEVAFREGVIIFTADVYEPLVGQLTVRFNPYVDDGHVRFEAIDASLGGSVTPQSTLDTAADTLSGTLGEALSYLPSSLRPREIVVANGEFTVIGGGADAGE